MSETLAVTDFERSCVRWRIDTLKKPVLTVSRPLPMTLNNVRAPLDARAVLTEQATGVEREYVLTVSCQAEQVWVPRDVWHDPPADMCVIAARDEFLIVKRWDRAEKGVMRHPATLGVQPERQRDDPAACFDRYGIERVTRPGRRLESVEAIVDTLFTHAPVVAQTEYARGGFRVQLEYPVKIVNFSEREKYYQVDTGPVLLPDLDSGVQPLISGMQLAYVAHNSPDWAEFLVCAPTPVVPGVKVHHYSRVVRIENAVNSLFAV
jgi:hypothetical protein